MVKKFKKDALKFGTVGITLGIGAAVGARASSVSGRPGLAAGFNTAAGFMPTIGAGVFGGHAIRLTKKLGGKKRKNKLGY